MSQSSQNNAYGLDCPECNYRIAVTLDMLVTNQAVFCSNCGLKLTIDQESSKESLHLLQKLNSKMKAAEHLKASSPLLKNR